MRGKIFRKIIVALIIIAPVFINPGCKKQAKCGCDGDVIETLSGEKARVYINESGTSMSFTLLSSIYNTYYFCNPAEMLPLLKDSKSGDILLIWGQAFWDCTYVYQQSNYSYQSQSQYYKVFQVQVTDMVVDLYGK
jgi:hypothetical protein